MEEVLACLFCGVGVLESESSRCEEDAKRLGIELVPGVEWGSHIWTVAKVVKDWDE